MTTHSHSSEGSQSGSGTDDPLIDWSHFEPNSVQIYDGSGSGWVMGRALWKPSYRAALTSALPKSPEGSASPDSLSTSSLGGAGLLEFYDDESDTGLTPKLKAEKKLGSYFPARPLSRSHSTFKPISRPLHSHVFPLPGSDTNNIVRQVGFFVARADDPEGQSRLQLEIQGKGVMYSAGLSVLPCVDTWTDKYGNLWYILHIPPQGITTLREMYVTAFAHGSRIGTPAGHGQKGVVTVLDQLLKHTIQLVSAMEVRLSFLYCYHPLSKTTHDSPYTNAASYFAAGAQTRGASSPRAPHTPTALWLSQTARA